MASFLKKTGSRHSAIPLPYAVKRKTAEVPELLAEKNSRTNFCRLPKSGRLKFPAAIDAVNGALASNHASIRRFGGNRTVRQFLNASRSPATSSSDVHQLQTSLADSGWSSGPSSLQAAGQG